MRNKLIFLISIYLLSIGCNDCLDGMYTEYTCYKHDSGEVVYRGPLKPSQRKRMLKYYFCTSKCATKLDG